MKKITTLLVAIAFALSLASSANALGVKDLEFEVMCMCPDNCGKVLGNCSCKYSDGYRIGLLDQIKAGMNKDEILDSWIDKYGEKGLSIPTKEGFNITAWVMPFFALFSALGFMFFIVRKWKVARSVDENGKHENKLEKISKEDKKILAGLEDELKHYDD